MNYDVNEQNVIVLAIKNYDSTRCLMSEFEEDFKRVKYIKRLIGKYKAKGEIKERLVLNHIIVLANAFGPEFTTKLLFLRVNPRHYDVLKTFLLFLQYLPDRVSTVNGQHIDTRSILVNMPLVELLRKI